MENPARAGFSFLAFVSPRGLSGATKRILAHDCARIEAAFTVRGRGAAAQRWSDVPTDRGRASCSFWAAAEYFRAINPERSAVMAREFDRAARQGFGFALGATIAVVIVICAAILLLVLFGLAV
jgi:hypothetical protein